MKKRLPTDNFIIQFLALKLYSWRFIAFRFGKSSSASPPPKSAPASLLNPSMISNPIPADKPVVQSNRPLPSRFRGNPNL